MKMLQCQFMFASLLVLNVGCFLEGSCQTVDIYTTKDAESLPCTITEQTPTVIWAEIVVGDSITVLTYQSGNPPLISISTEEKYNNFNYTLEPTSFNLVILNVEDEDGGVYGCSPFDSNPTTYDVTIEVLAKPTVKYDSLDVEELEVIVGTSYDLTCSATEARSVSDLSFRWYHTLEEKIPLNITPNGEYKDYSITSTYTAVKGDSSITCQLTGYVLQDEINDQRIEHISHTVNISVQYAPVCNLNIQEWETCMEVTLTCECDAVPAVISQYSFFNESILINDGTSNTFTVNAAYGTQYRFSCSATNVIDDGEKSDKKVHYCSKGTESSTEESMTTYSNTTGSGLGPGAIAGICCAASAAVIVIVGIAVMMFKNGKCGSISDSSHAADGNSTAKHNDIYEDELSLEVNEMKTGARKSSNSDTRKESKEKEAPAPVYAEVKKKRGKQDYNGPGKYPDIPPHGVINKKKAKGPTPAPSSSMRDSTNSTKLQQQTDTQSADTGHVKKSPQDRTGNQSADTDHDKESPQDETDTQSADTDHGKKFSQDRTGNQSADTDHDKESPQDETENQSADTDHDKESPQDEMETQYENIIYG